MLITGKHANVCPGIDKLNDRSILDA